MSKERRWPDLTRKVATDNFIFKLDGQDYHPHAGKWVIMKRKISSLGLATTLRFAAMARKGISTDEEGAEEFSRLLMETAEVLADNVLDWNWEDEEGKPYQKPNGDPKTMAKLHVQELMYLVGQYHEPAEVSKNSSTASSNSSEAKAESQQS
jgi:hypothetical protein